MNAQIVFPIGAQVFHALRGDGIVVSHHGPLPVVKFTTVPRNSIEFPRDLRIVRLPSSGVKGREAIPSVKAAKAARYRQNKAKRAEENRARASASGKKQK